jgi:hypothetical protein
MGVANWEAALTLSEQDLKCYEDRISQEAANVAAATQQVAAAQKEASDGIAAAHFDAVNKICDARVAHEAELHKVQNTLGAQLRDAGLRANAV